MAPLPPQDPAPEPRASVHVGDSIHYNETQGSTVFTVFCVCFCCLQYVDDDSDGL